MRVAVLSDIHGHLPALDAALVDVAAAAVDRIVVTGDIAAGPMPVPVLERLLALGAIEVHWSKRPPTADFVILADPEGNRFCVVHKPA